jgi:hypothetical protein
MVKIIRADYDEVNYTDAKIEHVEDFIGIPLVSGGSLRGRFPERTRVLVQSKRPPTDFFEAGPMPIVSQRVQDLFRRFEVNAEYYRVQVIQRKKTLPPHYYYNLLAEADCFDWDVSEYEREDVYATNIDRLLLKTSAIPDEPLFLVARTIPEVVCASDLLADALQQAGCTGLRILEVSDWWNPRFPEGYKPKKKK